jgi:RNA polymerase sigma factor (sigma-70 family)
MSATTLHSHLRLLMQSAVVEGLSALPDAELLEHFRVRREAAALEVIARRHGPLVLAVLRRHLSRDADLEDAFQATFLVLLRKAATIQHGISLSCWLHGVAWRVAARARTASQQRHQREQAAARPEAQEQPPEGERQEAIAVLRREMARLPASYQRVLGLSYFEGKTREEAAAVLGCSFATVKGVLERARRVLRKRLERRGITLTVGLLSSAVILPTATALPARFLALALETVTSSPRPAALSLAQEILMRYTISPGWWAAAAAVLASCITAFVLTTVPGLSSAAPFANGISPSAGIPDLVNPPEANEPITVAFRDPAQDRKKREQKERPESPLAKAVREFNQKAKGDPIGEKQSPLTEAEVIAAIRCWDRERDPVSDSTYRAYQKIADTGELPPGAELSFITYCGTHYDSKECECDVWWVDLQLPRSTFRIRDQKIAFRPYVTRVSPPGIDEP